MKQQLYYMYCLAVHICLLFNAMTRHSFVPIEFCNGIIVPLLKCKHGDASQLDMYRGITLSPVLSKLFESVLLDLFGLFLTSSDLQFGFKKNLGCSHALFPFNVTVRYFMNNNSRAFGAFLDISKAFDKVLHNGLFKKLLDRNVPVCLVLLLKYWYGHLQCAVRWNNALGNWFSILSGVRQGGVGLLSPVLFSVYIDDLITDLKLSRYGANIGNIFAGCLLYADDIVLLSPTCHGLQKLITACEQYGRLWEGRKDVREGQGRGRREGRGGEGVGRKGPPSYC